MSVEPERIYVDHGLTGTNRERPGLREALAACRAGDTLVVTKLDRLARSLLLERGRADDSAGQSHRPLPDGRPYDAASVALAKKVDGMACCSSQVMAMGRSPT